MCLPPIQALQAQLEQSLSPFLVQNFSRKEHRMEDRTPGFLPCCAELCLLVRPVHLLEGSFLPPAQANASER